MADEGFKISVPAYQRRGGKRQPCSVVVESQPGGANVHFATTGGAPFNSVSLNQSDLDQLSNDLQGTSHDKSRRSDSSPVMQVAGLLLALALGAAGGFVGRGLMDESASTETPRPNVSATAVAEELTTSEGTQTASESKSTEDTKKAKFRGEQPENSLGAPKELSSEALCALSYLSTPAFAGTEFNRQILGDWNLELYRRGQEDVLLSREDPGSARTLNGLFIDASRVEFAERKNGVYEFSDEKFGGPDRGQLAKTPASNLRLPASKRIVVDFRSGAYDATLKELDEFLDNKSIYYQGLRQLQVSSGAFVSNHGAYVAKSSEPSLTRFVSQLTRAAKTREDKVQRILNFVSTEISYDETEALADYETLKRANEVLITRKSDCSGKAILLASLLEQIKVPYLLAYYPSHITVFVEKGSFPSDNGYEIKAQNRTYVLAEGTTPDFTIGKSVLEGDFSASRIEILQEPATARVMDRFGQSQ